VRRAAATSAMSNIGTIRALAALSLALAALAATPAGAGAKVVHSFQGSFNGSESPAGFFVPFGVAVDNSGGSAQGDIYVSSLFEVDRFSPTGVYEARINETPAGPFEETPLEAQDAVGAAGTVLVGDTFKEAVDEFSSEGAFIKSVAVGGDVFAVAVDPAGDIFVATGSEVVKYDAATKETGTFATETPAGNFEHTSGVATDNDPTSPRSGDVYVVDQERDAIDVFGPSGIYDGEVVAPAGHERVNNAVVDPATGGLFVTAGRAVDEFGPDGTFISETVLPEEGEASTVGVNAQSGQLYVGDERNDRVDVFNTEVVPTVELGSAAEVTQSEAVFGGEVTPDGGNVTACRFEYVNAAGYNAAGANPYAAGSTASCSPATPYSESTDVTAQVTGLTEDTTYHYRLVAQGPGGTGYSSDGTFVTLGIPTATLSGVVANATSATVHAAVDPHGAASTCEVEYVSETAFEAGGFEVAAVAPCSPREIASGEAQQVTADLVGLAVDTSYRLRFRLHNGYGEEFDGESSFVTFGIMSFTSEILDENGAPFRQAGGHPDALTTTVVFDQTQTSTVKVASSGNVRDVRVQLPRGFVGNPLATARCTRLEAELERCGGAAQVGLIAVGHISENGPSEQIEVQPLYNVEPARGVAAEFVAIINGGASAVITARVRTGEGYGVEADGLNIPSFVDLTSVRVTLWGVPGAASHDEERYCPAPGGGHEHPCQIGVPPTPLLTTPTSCDGSELTASLTADSYQTAEGEGDVTVSTTLPGMTGCEHVPFAPSISVAPETHSASTPTGIEAAVTVPQETAAESVATADLENATVRLPAGITLNPSAAGSLVGCPLLHGKEGHEGQTGIDLEDGEAANCPAGSQLGTVELDTPLLDHALHGEIYAAQQGDAGAAQGSNPFGSLLAIYVAIDDPKSGVVVKLAGEVTANPETGQLTTTFDENPQLPFEELKLDFFGGPRAPLATPSRCGAYTTTSVLEPWSHEPAEGETAGTPNAEPSSSFSVTSGPGGTACPAGAAPFAPSLIAGSTNNQAAAFSPLTVVLKRGDGEQAFSTVSLKLPRGLAGMVSHVEQCPEAQANVGACPAASKIGHVVVRAGVGSQPVTIPQPGKPEDPVYLTGPYKGAPFGIAIVVPAEAGPFDLDEGGHPVVVRGKVNVDPHTAQVSVETEAMPTMLQGVPLEVRDIEVSIDKPEFMFNPTNCEATAVDGRIGSAEGASETVASRFQAANCAALPFKPTLRAETKAHHTRKDGAFLRIAVTSGSGQANIAKVHVRLPKKLPADERTLKQACLEAQFAANPAGCPKASFVGTAVAHTPVLSSALSGPAVYVSNGHAAFPNLDVVLQGEGVTVILEGSTFIGKKGYTSSTFASLPDMPISSFVLSLPEDENPALGGNGGNLCSKSVTKHVRKTVHGRAVHEKRRVKRKLKLTLPTTITGQNGAVIEKTTVLRVSGCAVGTHGKQAGHKARSKA
jgi:hypothetical protein